MDADNLRTEELTAAIREVQQRVRARHPGGSLGDTGVALPDLIPLLHARDAAEAKVAAIGRVNPRPGGLLNQAIQGVKRLISRALDWHVREQVEFNRAAVQCVHAMLETFEQNNQALSRMAGFVQEQTSRLRGELEAVESSLRTAEADAAELKDIRRHWVEWRQGWEEKLNRSEVYMLRTISELNASFQHRSTLTEDSFRKAMLEQHGGFQNLLAKAGAEIQERLWADLSRIRGEYEKLIHDELRVIRQRSAASRPEPVASAVTVTSGAPQIDWLKFADRFRGSEESIRRAQSLYVGRFAGLTDVLDIGCGRGEFLEAARAAGIGARGIDLSEECVALCRSKGLDAEVADLFAYLAALPDRSLGGVYCSQVVEHLSPAALPEMIRLLGAKVRSGGLAAFETPNPECLAIFATHFYLDPTHVRPVPAPLLAFYLEETGFGQIDIQPLSPAIDTMPALETLPPAFRQAFFGGLDYALFGQKH